MTTMHDPSDPGAVTATLYVIRHACAGRKGEWPGDDMDRPLDEAGLEQARALADALAGCEISGLESSPGVRCVQSLEPLAERLGLPIESSPALTQTGDLATLVAATPDHQLAGRVWCTHGETMEPLLDWLRSDELDADAPEVPDARLLAKGTGWAVDLRDGRPVAWRHIAPDAPVDCQQHTLPSR